MAVTLMRSQLHVRVEQAHNEFLKISRLQFKQLDESQIQQGFEIA